MLVHARLARLFHDLKQELPATDELSLANPSKSIYTVYVSKRNRVNYAASRKVEVDDNGEIKISIRTVRGGLPSWEGRAQ